MSAFFVQVDGSELLLKPNTATQKFIDDVQQKRDQRRRQQQSQVKPGAAANGTTSAQPTEEEQDEAADNEALEQIMAMISDRAPETAAANASRASDFMSSLDAERSRCVYLPSLFCHPTL